MELGWLRCTYSWLYTGVPQKVDVATVRFGQPYYYCLCTKTTFGGLMAKQINPVLEMQSARL